MERPFIVSVIFCPWRKTKILESPQANCVYPCFMNCAGAARSHTAVILVPVRHREIAQPRQRHVQISVYHIPCFIDSKVRVRYIAGPTSVTKERVRKVSESKPVLKL